MFDLSTYWIWFHSKMIRSLIRGIVLAIDSLQIYFRLCPMILSLEIVNFFFFFWQFSYKFQCFAFKFPPGIFHKLFVFLLILVQVSAYTIISSAVLSRNIVPWRKSQRNFQYWPFSSLLLRFPDSLFSFKLECKLICIRH